MAKKRIKNDAYYTEPRLALGICKGLHPFLVMPATPHILEPSAGAGSFCLAARECWGPDAHITAVEPFPSWRTHSGHDLRIPGANITQRITFENYCLTFRKNPPGPDFDLTLGNPPYKDGEAHVQLARARSRYVAFLLRFSFLGSQRRAKTIFGAPGLRYIMPLAERPSFTDTGSDNSEYATFLWQRDYTGMAEVLPHLWVGSDE